jgi:hypothetical protein
MKEKVSTFFDLLKSEMHKMKGDPAKSVMSMRQDLPLFNAQEQMFSGKGKNQVARLSSAENCSTQRFEHFIKMVKPKPDAPSS